MSLEESRMNEQEFQEVVGFLEETPESIRQLTAELARTECRWKPSIDEFSALEQVCHLRDLEREGYALRIKKLLTENHPLLPDFDGGRIARERDYNSQDFEAAFQDFALARAENVHVMKTLSPEQLNRSGVLDGVGAITLKKLFLLMRDHDRSHLEELTELRKRKAGTKRDAETR
ncbi:MAG TPA: DinB family protein [Pyrinomonadaceae bacterium]